MFNQVDFRLGWFRIDNRIRHVPNRLARPSTMSGGLRAEYFAKALGILGLACLLALGSAQPSVAAIRTSDSRAIELRLIQVVPDRPGVYVWCDDAEWAFNSLFKYLSRTGQHDDLADIFFLLEESNDEVVGTKALASAARTVRRLREGIIDSQIMWAFTRIDDAQSCHSLIAHSSSSADEIEEFMIDVGTLAASMRNGPNADPKEPVVESVHWTFEDGWLIWTDRPEELEILENSVKYGSDRSLADNRSFQTLFSGASDKQHDWPSMSVFVSSESIPKLLVSGGLARKLLDVRGQADWSQVCRAAFVDEIRGLGGNIYLPNDDLVDRLGWTLAWDISLLVSLPRHGIFAAVEQGSGIDFDVPLFDMPLAHFAQIELNGMHLAQGINETNDRVLEIADLAYSFGKAARSVFFLNLHSLDKIDGPSSEALLRETTKALSVEYFAESSSEDFNTELAGNWNAIEIGSGGTTHDLVTEALNDGQDGTWSGERNGGLSTWSISRTSESRLQENLEDQLQRRIESGNIQFTGPVTIRLAVNNSEESEGGQRLVLGDGRTLSFVMPDLVQTMRNQFRDKLSRYLSQSYVRIGDWLFVRPIRIKDLERVAESQRGIGKRQLEDVETTFDTLNVEFETVACGVFAQWPRRLRQSLKSVLPVRITSERENTSEPTNSTRDESEFESLVDRLIDYRDQIESSLDKLVLVLADERTGFRIVGSVTRKTERE